MTTLQQQRLDFSLVVLHRFLLCLLRHLGHRLHELIGDLVPIQQVGLEGNHLGFNLDLLWGDHSRFGRNSRFGRTSRSGVSFSSSISRRLRRHDEGVKDAEGNHDTQSRWAPTSCKWSVITTFARPFTGVTTSFITSRGPPYSISVISVISVRISRLWYSLVGVQMMNPVPKCGTGTTSRDHFSNCFCLAKDMSSAFEQSHRYEQQYVFV